MAGNIFYLKEERAREVYHLRFKKKIKMKKVNKREGPHSQEAAARSKMDKCEDERMIRVPGGNSHAPQRI